MDVFPSKCLFVSRVSRVSRASLCFELNLLRKITVRDSLCLLFSLINAAHHSVSTISALCLLPHAGWVVGGWGGEGPDSNPTTSSSPSLGFHEGESRLHETSPPPMPPPRCVGGPWASPQARRPSTTFPQLLLRPCRVARPVGTLWMHAVREHEGVYKPGRKHQQLHQFRVWRVAGVLPKTLLVAEFCLGGIIYLLVTVR